MTTGTETRATAPRKAPPHSPAAGRPVAGLPPRPSGTAQLRGYCASCRRWTTANEATGLIARHAYPKWDTRNRRGRCAGVGTEPAEVRWAEPV